MLKSVLHSCFNLVHSHIAIGGRTFRIWVFLICAFSLLYPSRNCLYDLISVFLKAIQFFWDISYLSFKLVDFPPCMLNFFLVGLYFGNEKGEFILLLLLLSLRTILEIYISLIFFFYVRWRSTPLSVVAVPNTGDRIRVLNGILNNYGLERCLPWVFIIFVVLIDAFVWRIDKGDRLPSLFES